jgi:hypothetical protein
VSCAQRFDGRFHVKEEADVADLQLLQASERNSQSAKWMQSVSTER